MADEEDEEPWPFRKIEHIRYTKPDDWTKKEWNTNQGPPTWIHESGLVAAVRAERDGEARITLSPPYEDPVEMEELDGKFMKSGAEGYLESLIQAYD